MPSDVYPIAEQPVHVDPPSHASGCSIFLLILTFFWIVTVSLSVPVVSWLAEQFALALGGEWPFWLRPLLSLGQVVLLALPVLPLAWSARDPRQRAVYRMWGWGIGYVALALPLRLLDVTQESAASVLQVGVTLLFLLLLLIAHRKEVSQTNRAEESRGLAAGASLWQALLFVGLISVPWLAWGAFGSLLDIFLGLASAALFGMVVAVLVDTYLPRAPSPESLPRVWTLVAKAIALGALLLVMVSGFAWQGSILLLVLSVPAVSFAVVGLWAAIRSGKARLPVALLIAGAVAAPLTLVDPEELLLVLNSTPGEILQWALLAAIVSMFTAWLLGLFFLVPPAQRAMRRFRTPWVVGAGVAVALALGVYVTVGQPGLYGERLFVILADQADVSRASEIQEREARLEFVYDTLTAHAVRTQTPLRAALERFGIEYSPYYLVNALEVDGGPLIRWWLQSRPEVARVLDSPRLRPLPEPPPLVGGEALAPAGTPWNLTLIEADKVWRELGITGEGIIIGQSDSGVEWEHPELQESYRGGVSNHDFNWYDPWYGTKEPRDLGGHGTHTLGSVLGESVGVAPGATWYACVNLGRNLANPALYLDCLQFMLAPFPLGGDPFTEGVPALAAHISNNSWGCPEIEGCDAEALLPAVRALRTAGIFVVASAGNTGPSCASIEDPIALYDEVFTVGAGARGGELAEFSSRGPVTVDDSGRIKPDIVAPGVDVLSAYPGGSYFVASGTSMAGPHVAGVVALMWAANPDLIGEIELTEEILIETASPYVGPLPDCGAPGAVPNNGIGYGIVDAYDAVQAALAVQEVE